MVKPSKSFGLRSTERQRALGLIKHLSHRDVSSQYKRTALGRLWSLLNPLAMIAIYSLIFGVIFQGQVRPGIRSGMESFALWIAIGVIAWGFFSRSLTGTMNSLIYNQSLLTKVYFPRIVLPVSTVVSNTINHIPEVIVLVIVVMFASGPNVLVLLPALVGAVLMTGGFALGVGMALSIAVIYFRDLEHLWGIVSQAWMFASGVVFPIYILEDVQQRLFEQGVAIMGQPIPLLTIFQFNPAYTFLELYRNILYDMTWPSWQLWSAALGWVVAAVALGLFVFRKHSARIVEEL